MVGKSCLEACLLKRKSCPLCGIEIFKQAPSNESNAIKNLKSITLNCDFKNCKEIISYDNYYGHLNKCKFNPKNLSQNLKKCIYCYEDFDTKIIKAHEQNCENRTETCDFCNKTYQVKDVDYHILVDCDFVKITCEYCGDTFNKKEYEEHEKNRAACDITIARKFNNLRSSSNNLPNIKNEIYNQGNYDQYHNSNNNFNNNGNNFNNNQTQKRSHSSSKLTQVNINPINNNNILTGNKLRRKKIF